jgi:phytoene synthase
LAQTGDRGGLDQLVGRVDPDRWLASRFIGDAEARADVIALYAYDYELGRAARAASNDLIIEIRLTWWREVLDEAFGAGAVRRHPTAEALAAAVRRRRLRRELLEAMIDGRIEVLGRATLDAQAAVRWADQVEGAAAVLAAAILDAAAPAEAARPAGRAWGLSLLRRARLAAAPDVDAALRAALAQARVSARSLGVTAFPAALSARLARFDVDKSAPGPLRKRLALVIAAARAQI